MIAVVINYCTNDYRFLSACLSEARKFSSEIIVPVCDHFFDGVVEDRVLLERSYAEHPDVKFVEFAFDREPYGLYATIKEGDPDWIHYWHSTSRYVGNEFVSSAAEYVLFLDVDEVVDGEKMRNWLKAFAYTDFDAIRFTSYFYFREARFQATKVMRNGLLVRKLKLTPDLLLDVRERRGVFDHLVGNRLEDVYSLDGQPLVHHYSWVKTKAEMQKKVVSWGHHLDKDWLQLIEEEFAAPFDLKDRFWGFDYREVTPLIDPLQVRIPVTPITNPYPNVTKVTRKSLEHRRILSQL